MWPPLPAYFLTVTAPNAIHHTFGIDSGALSVNEATAMAAEEIDLRPRAKGFQLQVHRLPQHDHRGAIAPQLAVHGQQQHRFNQALAHQQAIKGIPVDAICLQIPHRKQMGVADGSQRKPCSGT